MGRRSNDRATDCDFGSTDWTTLGARIRHVAAIAGAVHRMESGAATGAIVADTASEGTVRRPMRLRLVRD
jgi:hypothetical protein